MDVTIVSTVYVAVRIHTQTQPKLMLLLYLRYSCIYGIGTAVLHLIHFSQCESQSHSRNDQIDELDVQYNWL